MTWSLLQIHYMHSRQTHKLTYLLPLILTMLCLHNWKSSLLFLVELVQHCLPHQCNQMTPRSPLPQTISESLIVFHSILFPL